MELALSGQSDHQIAHSLHRSYWTCRKWRRRSQKQGRLGLSSPIGRPAKGCLSSFPAPLVQALLQLRQHHPGWGPQTLRTELALSPQWGSYKLPCLASIANVLKATGLIKAYHSRTPPCLSCPSGVNQVHQEWELDAQGQTQVEGLGPLALINILDRFSRLKVESYPTPHSRQPDLGDYQLALRHAFTQYGLPKALSLDHAGVFYDNSTDPPYPTHFHLWLIALGVEVHFSRKAHPTDHARVERLHQTMEAQALEGQTYSQFEQIWASLDQRRERLNSTLPCRTLAGKAPLKAFPTALHSGRWYRPEMEGELLELERVWNYLGQPHQHWFRTVRPAGTVWLGGKSYYVGRSWAKQKVEIHFESFSQQLVFQVADSDQIVKVAIKGLSKAELMGELTSLLQLPTYQLALPFSSGEWRQLEYAQRLLPTGTT